jgi:hypothetical protein
MATSVQGPKKKASPIVKFGGGFIVLIMALGVYAALTNDEKQAGGVAARTPAKAAAAPSALAVDNMTLWRDYEANEVAADNKYKGRILAVGGRVDSIDKNFADEIIVRLSSPNQFMTTMATMEKSQAGQAAQLSKGETVTLVCEGQGRIMGAPSLGGCVFK